MMAKKRAVDNSQGQGLVEYALLLMLVSVVVVVILTLLGPQVGNVFSRVTTAMAGPSGEEAPPTPAMITNASANYSGGQLTVSVTLDQNGTITVTHQGSGKTSTVSCNPTCQVTFSGVSDEGTVVVTAPGNSRTINYDD